MTTTNTLQSLAKEAGVDQKKIQSVARDLKIPIAYNGHGKRVFSNSQASQIKTMIQENVLTEHLKGKIRCLMSELLENTPAGYAVRLLDMKNFLISQHIKRDFCQYGCISLMAGPDFMIYDTGAYGAKTIIALSPLHKFITEEPTEQRMNELLPYYHKPKHKDKVL